MIEIFGKINQAKVIKKMETYQTIDNTVEAAGGHAVEIHTAGSRYQSLKKSIHNGK